MTDPAGSADEDRFFRAMTRALDELPEEFRAQLDSVAIAVEDAPTPEQLQAAHAYGLFGIYQGVPRTAYGASNAAIPSKITLFRGPIEAYSANDADLARRVQDTLYHEIAHHFGISDARLREMAAQRGGRQTE